MHVGGEGFRDFWMPRDADEHETANIVDPNVACMNLQTRSDLQILITPRDLDRHNKLHLFYSSHHTSFHFETSKRELALDTMMYVSRLCFRMLLTLRKKTTLKNLHVRKFV